MAPKEALGSPVSVDAGDGTSVRQQGRDIAQSHGPAGSEHSARRFALLNSEGYMPLHRHTTPHPGPVQYLLNQEQSIQAS